jgi:prepilin-type N-terminal cleavage/methylation domain-containing protein
MKRQIRRRRGLSLLELTMALTVFAILALAGYTLIAGAMNTDRYLRAANTAESEMELAIRRITFNLRTAAVMTTPSTTTASSTLTITTQPDTSNSNAQYTVSYRVSNGNLIENDSRYGTAGSAAADNTICRNVSTFTVQLLNTTSSPKTITVTLTTTGAQPVTRTFKVACRNL